MPIFTFFPYLGSDIYVLTMSLSGCFHFWKRLSFYFATINATTIQLFSSLFIHDFSIRTSSAVLSQRFIIQFYSYEVSGWCSQATLLYHSPYYLRFRLCLYLIRYCINQQVFVWTHFFHYQNRQFWGNLCICIQYLLVEVNYYLY